MSQFQIDANVAVEVRLSAVEVEVADRDVAVILAEARIDGFAHDAVHAGERADVYDSIHTVSGQVGGLADADHHFAFGARVRQVGTCQLQDLRDVGFFVACEVFGKRRQQRLHVCMLDTAAQLGLQHLQRKSTAGEAQVADFFGVGVRNPLRDVGHPALGAVALEAAHQIFVAEVIQAAENLAYNADKWDLRIVARGQLLEALAGTQKGGDQGFKLAIRVGATCLQGLAEIAYGFLEGSVGASGNLFVGSRLQQQLAQNFRRNQGAPGGANERSSELTDVAVTMLAARRKNLHAAVAVVAQNFVDEGGILAETTGTICRGHEVDRAIRIKARLLDDLEEISNRDFSGIALVSAGVPGAQFAGALIGGRRGMRLDAKPLKDRSKSLDAALGQRGNVDHFSRQRMVVLDLGCHTAMAEVGHRRNPLLSR